MFRILAPYWRLALVCFVVLVIFDNEISTTKPENEDNEDLGPVFEKSFSEQLCEEPPPPLYGELHCGQHKKKKNRYVCKTECEAGFQFPNGKKKSRHFCDMESGLWTPEFTFPDCQPICEPPCENAGECAEENHCICTPQYRGNRCEFPIDVCDPASSFHVSADWTCNHTSAETVCVQNCPQGTRYENQPADLYTCTPEGTWTPSSAPKCVPINIIEPPSSHGIYSITTGQLVQISQSGVCAAWGPSHIRTFDGGLYSFWGSCTYLLAKDCADGTFSIHLSNSVPCERPTECQTSLVIYLGSEQLVLKNTPLGPVVEADGQIHRVPKMVKGLLLQMLSDYVTVTSSLGFRLKWDQKNTVLLKVDNQLKNKTCGLCGRFDGTVLNDFETSDGTITDSVERFVNSWTMDGLGEKCEDQAIVKDLCSEDKAKFGEAERACNAIFDKKFDACHSLLDPKAYFEACRMDHCGCSFTDGNCHCNSLSEYFRECVRLGGKIEGGWRSNELCPLNCPDGMIYKDCGTSCPKTCKNTVYDCEDDHCVDGCHCPPGTILHNGQCIERHSCPCFHKGVEHQPGERILQECNACECNAGTWDCTKQKCEARCSSTGDPHYSTFDGVQYEFLGTCPYYLVYSDEFTVVQETSPCTEVWNTESEAESASQTTFCTRSVKVTYNESTLVMKTKMQITVDERVIANLPLTENGFAVHMATSMFIKVELPNDVSLMWDGHNRIYIDAPPTLEGKTKGLCGTFNRNQNDDFLTPEGDLEADVSTFANRWKASDSCHKRSRRSELSPCQSQPQKLNDAENLCSVIKSDIFRDCHDEIDPTPIYKGCVSDLCMCNQDLPECLCPILADYGSACSRKGKVVNWADQIEACKPSCTNGQEYSECANPCMSSCSTIAAAQMCIAQCVQGCACPRGMTLNEENFCVAIDQCHCVYNEKEYTAGSVSIQETNMCTCENALWQCRPARLEELMSSHSNWMLEDDSMQCNDDNAEEYTSCQELCPRSCQNLHLPAECRTKICRPGCRCKTGYILDSDTGRCVKISECGCRHGGKKYTDGKTVKKDCNLCTCQQGIWKCTEKKCPGVCTAWGESHFKTFDGKIYDFQGECEYLMSKGKIPTVSYRISVQNVPCATSGITCSKSFTLEISRYRGPNRGDTQEEAVESEKITLLRGDSIPKRNAASMFAVLETSSYVFVHTDVGISLQWDKGTRLYVTVDPRWRNKVQGLCGNYNDDQQDDFLPPWGGAPETRPASFAECWKIYEFCPTSESVEDICALHPARKTWAHQKCGILKSDLFQPCHSEVNLDPYYERCIFDTCACDAGGDCECLCTAISTYAQECNMHGVHIKWRSPDVCPIQCEECATYESCISPCPPKTCETQFLQHRIDESCSKDTCVDGCKPKPCEEGYIFNNAKEFKCIPLVDCVVPCLEINGRMYNEGERVTEPGITDPCQSCHCRRGSISCSGQTCPTTIISRLYNIEPPCVQTGWTPWMNTPPVAGGDFELLENPVLAAMYGDYCGTNNITSIECRVAGTKVPHKEAGQNVLCDLPEGLVCKHQDQGDRLCDDYEIRLFCDCGMTTPSSTCVSGWTEYFNVDHPTPDNTGDEESVENIRKHHDLCLTGTIVDVECKTLVGGQLIDYSTTGQFGLKCSKNRGFICNNFLQSKGEICFDYVVRFFCSCEPTTPAPTTTPVITTTLESVTPVEEICGWTPWLNADQPKSYPEDEGDIEDIGLLQLVYKICGGKDLADIECRMALTHHDFHESNQKNLRCDLENGFRCHNKDQIGACYDYEVRVLCMYDWCRPTIPSTTTEELVITTANPCPDGEVYDKCAYNCNQMCSAFSYQLSQMEGKCNNKSPNDQCIEGCRPIKGCQPPDLWRDHYNCVPKEECTCILAEESATIVAPHELVVIGCEKCQCIDNNLLCYKIPGCGEITTTAASLILETTTRTSLANITNDDCWTDWINVDTPFTGSGDFENLATIRKKFEFCSDPVEVECRTVIAPELELKPRKRVKGASGSAQSVYTQCLSTGWTPWMSGHVPDENGETESLQSLRSNHFFCSDNEVEKIECRSITGWKYVDGGSGKGSTKGGRKLICDKKTGFACKGPNCEDYEVRVYCDCSKTVKKKRSITKQSMVCDLKSGLTCWNSDNKPDGCNDYEIRFFCPCAVQKPVTTTTPMPTLPPAPCAHGWTEWYNSHVPDTEGEYETVQSARAHGGYFCSNEMITAMECKRVDSPLGTPLQHGVTCEANVGFICKNKYLGGFETCSDYAVRFFCDCPTEPPSTVSSVVTEKMPHTTTRLPQLEACSYWSDWINENHPVGTKGGINKKNVKGAGVFRGDVEKRMLLRMQQENGFCVKGHLSDIECRDAETDEDYTETGDRKLVCSLAGGLRCRAKDQQNRICRDYKIRYFCECEASTTTIILRPTTPTVHVPSCMDYYDIIDGENPLPDTSLTASSSKDAESGPQSARLSTTASFKSAGAWIAGHVNDHQYIEVDLGGIRPVYGVVTKGRDGAPEWVESYKVLYSRNGMAYAYVKEPQTVDVEKIFTGNYDSDSPVEHFFEMPFEARFVRIQPITYHKEIALRMDILGCAESNMDLKEPTRPPTTQQTIVCRDEMGLINGTISDSQIIATSQRNLNCGPNRVRLNTLQTETHSGGWVAKFLDEDQYVQVDLLEPRVLTGIIIQGRNVVPQWVTAFTVSYSEEGFVWNDILQDNSEKKVFAGNYDSDTPMTSFFPRPIRARAIRVHPVHWHNWIAMRIEILGCFEPYAYEMTTEDILGETLIPTMPYILQGHCEEPMGFESGHLPDELISVSSSASPWSGASRIRLNTPNDKWGTGAWVAATADHKPEIYIDFYGERNISGILTQGREDADMWIMSYTVEYSSDNETWIHTADSFTKNLVFAGNFDRNTPVLRLFTTMITARFLKITILDYHNSPALRMEVLGCYKPYVEELPPTPLYITPTEYCMEYGPWLSLTDPASSFVGDEEPVDKIIEYSGTCSNPVGIQCREMLTHQDHSKTGQIVSCDLTHGLLCTNQHQVTGHCYNYEARIKCWSCGISTTPKPHPPLHICPEVPESLKSKCPVFCPNDYESCDGSRCVLEVDCPCFREGKRFNPADVLITEQCERCECSIEGHSKCKPIQCDKHICEAGQKSKLNKHCDCECVGCPVGTVVCPSNDQCIQEERWCDGVVDCPDDETNCPTTQRPTTTTLPTTTESPIVCSTDYLPYTATCYMVANVFETFDGLSYQYDICDHVLMKEKSKEQYYVTVHKSCLLDDASKCRKYINIKVDDLLFKLGPGSDELTLNQINVPLSNLWLLSRRFQDFELKKEGNHLIFRSFKYHFDVTWDAFEDTIITISKCAVNQVVGMCGLYNKILEDDRTMPNGDLAPGIEVFGDSWSMGSKERCLPPECPVHVMKKAVDTCEKLNQPPFNECFDYLNRAARIDACIAHMCDCLQQTLDARFSASTDVFQDIESCQCLAYDSFVDACETLKNGSISEWRIQYDCTPDCAPGLEWQDCGPGCELNCDNYHQRLEICGQSCVPGCYCPPGLVRHHNRCVKPKMCQDCVCRGHGDPNYITFDGKYYAFQGNCTYVLAQHQTSGQDLNFQILATNYECPEEPQTSCTEGLKVIWNSHTVQKFYNQPVFLDGVPLKAEDSPFEVDGISITFVPEKSTLIHIQDINLVVRYFDQMYGFNVELPAHIYFNKTEGLCGVCNFDDSDDFYHRSGYVTEDIEDFAYSWLDEGYMRKLCTFPREVLPTPPPYICNFTANPCELFLNPDLYAKSCKNDVSYSRNPDASMCRSKFQYAQQCCERGVPLVEWLRQSGCEFSCPKGMVFECSSACPVTCYNYNTYRADDCDMMNLYTCTCPPGKMLKAGHCVDEYQCKICDAEGHIIGDVWSPEPCKSCECMPDLSVSCTVIQCPEPPICMFNETLSVLPAHPDECCNVYLCKAVERKECLSVPEPECKPGESKVLDFVNDCPTYFCECKSLLCPPPVKPTAIREDGEQFILDMIGCCQQYVSKCFPETCAKPPNCGPGFKSVTYEGKCCTQYNCIQKEEVCVFQHKYKETNGTSIPLPLEEYFDAEYEGGSSWRDGPCTQCQCVVSEAAKVICENKMCPEASEFPDADKYVRLEEYIPEVCCPKYHRIKCKSNESIYSAGDEWASPDGDKCKTLYCMEVEKGGEVIIAEKTTVCEKTCPDFAVYEEAPSNSTKCCGYCKPIACEENGYVYQAGATWESKSKPCFNAECLVTGNNAKVLYHRVMCPAVPENCPQENIVTDPEGCCTYCKTSVESCSPVAVPVHETAGFFHLVDQERGVCSNSQWLKNLTRCFGQCDSTSLYSTLMDNFESTCKCCLPVISEKRDVILDCEDGSKLEKIYQQPISCECSSCSEGYNRGTIELPTPY